MKRRQFLATLGGVAVTPALAGVAAARDVEIRPRTVAVDDTEQVLTLTATELEEDVAELVLAVDVTPLAATANVGLDDLAVEDDRTDLHGAQVTDSAVVRDGDETIVELTIDVSDTVFRGTVVLSGLDTADAEHGVDLAYDATVRTGADDEATAIESTGFSVVDPAQREPELGLRAGNLEHGATEHRFAVRLDEVPTGVDELVLDIDVTDLKSAGVAFSDPAVSIESVADATVSSATAVELGGRRVIRILLEPDEDAVSLVVTATVTGLDTADADHDVDVPYYARVARDEHPDTPPDRDDNPAASVRVVDPERVTPKPSPDGTDVPAGTPPDEEGAHDDGVNDGGGNAGDGDSDPERAGPDPPSLPGFGVLAAVGGLLTAAGASIRRNGAGDREQS